MKRAVQLVLAAVGAAVCVLATAHFWWTEVSRCPVPAPLLIELALVGIAGLALVVVNRETPSARWRVARGVVLGALIALTVLAVWTMVPRVLLATLAFGVAFLLDEPLFSRRMLGNVALVAAISTLNLVILFPVAKGSDIETVEVPRDSVAIRAFASVDYADAYRARIPAASNVDLESVTRKVFSALQPCWASQSDRDRFEAALQTFRFQAGTALGGWTVYHRTADEIVVGADASHLNFRVSIFLSRENGARWLTVSTVVHFNNWKGTAYFIPVRVGHKIIVPHAVRTAVYNLR